MSSSESSILGVHLHMAPVCYNSLMSSITLSFGRRWVSISVIYSVQFYPHCYKECISVRIDGCMSSPGRSKDTARVLRHFPCQGRSGSRQQGQTSGCYWEVRVILEGCSGSWLRPIVGIILCVQGPCKVQFNEAQSPWTKQLPLSI